MEREFCILFSRLRLQIYGHGKQIIEIWACPHFAQALNLKLSVGIQPLAPLHHANSLEEIFLGILLDFQSGRVWNQVFKNTFTFIKLISFSYVNIFK
jgi:hypothetical protein